MARKPRVGYEEAPYHVMRRGNGGADISCGDKDRWLFLGTLDEACRRSAGEIHVFMPKAMPGEHQGGSPDGGGVRAVNEHSAEALVAKCVRALDIRDSDLAMMRKTDLRKAAVCGVLKRQIIVGSGWIRERLRTGTRLMFRTDQGRSAKRRRRRWGGCGET